MAMSATTTPKRLFATPKRLGKENLPPQTPECFQKVTVETPISNKRTSRDRGKADRVSNLQVAIRIRPMNARELRCVGSHDVISVDWNSLLINVNSSTTNMDHTFQYDHVFWSCDEKDDHYSSQEHVFASIGEPLLDSAFGGYNACLLAYGQTGSGKSYSMMGQPTGDIIDIDVNAGIIPRFCKELFERLHELNDSSTSSVEISYFEIYNEKIHDLFAMNSGSKLPLKVREHPVWGPYVVDLSVYTVKSYKELRNYLKIGNKNRATAATTMNDNSSRSHSIFTIEISVSDGNEDGDSCRRSKVNLVDLAGSERLNNVGNNEEIIKQGVSINKSLLTLRKVISALAEQKKSSRFVPYRDSVLTWLLRESLGGNSLTCMLATITPASTNIEETLATLRYACQARSIVNRAMINENPNDRLIRELRQEVGRLRALRQDYERSSLGTLCIDTSADYEQELEDLRHKLSEKEEELLEAQFSWQRRFMETKKKQMEELAEAEKYKEELESHVRVLSNIKDDVKVSPYRSNFLLEVESVLNDNSKPSTPVVTKQLITDSMNQIYSLLMGLRPMVDANSDENVMLTFAKANKALQTFEAAINASIKPNQKTVTFKL